MFKLLLFCCCFGQGFLWLFLLLFIKLPLMFVIFYCLYLVFVRSSVSFDVYLLGCLFVAFLEAVRFCLLVFVMIDFQLLSLNYRRCYCYCPINSSFKKNLQFIFLKKDVDRDLC